MTILFTLSESELVPVQFILALVRTLQQKFQQLKKLNTQVDISTFSVVVHNFNKILSYQL